MGWLRTWGVNLQTTRITHRPGIFGVNLLHVRIVLLPYFRLRGKITNGIRNFEIGMITELELVVLTGTSNFQRFLVLEYT
jgi:hypothetical protein